MNFAEHLATLPTVDHIAGIELFDGDRLVATIENRPGSSGSVRIYAWLAQRYGKVDRESAQEGLRLYAEHAEDAHLHPGKHPNIDRLLDLGDKSLRLVPT